MMRTPALAFARAEASRILRVLSVSGVCREMKVRAPQKRVEIDLFDPQLDRPVVRQERIESDDPHAQADRTFRNDGTDIAAADDPQGLGVDLHAHEPALFPFARLGRRSAAGCCRASASIRRWHVRPW